MNSQARITALGTYTPDRILTNFDLEQMIDTSDEWIRQRTGIRERRIAAADQFTSSLCFAAIEDMLQRYQKQVSDVDLIIVCTSTPDYPFPSVASLIQARFQIKQAGAIDLSATCAGFTYGLHLANGLITAGLQRKVLVIGAETLSKVTDYSDRTTCILFGDGAGAVLVERDPEQPSFHAAHLGSKGDGGVHLFRTGLSTRLLEQHGHTAEGKIVQNGREVMKWALKTVPTGMQAVMEQAQATLDQVDWFIPHSANLRMIESICERSGYPLEQTLYSLEYFGNTSAATIPLALDLGIKQGKVQSGDKLLLFGFGGGLVYAGLLITWNPHSQPGNRQEEINGAF